MLEQRLTFAKFSQRLKTILYFSLEKQQRGILMFKQFMGQWSQDTALQEKCFSLLLNPPLFGQSIKSALGKNTNSKLRRVIICVDRANTKEGRPAIHQLST
jgi:hypothetical protein